MIFPPILSYNWASLVAQMIKNLPAMQETQIPELGRIPWTRERQPTPVFSSLFPKFHPTQNLFWDFPGGASGKESACIAGFHPCVEKIPWRRKWQPTPVFLSGESHG